MKKALSMLLTLCTILAVLALPVSAASSARSYQFELSTDGRSEKEVAAGDIITISFSLKRTDAEDGYPMYAMQDEILYDSSFFELVEGSIMTNAGVSVTDLATRTLDRSLYINFLSLGGGETWQPDTLIGTVQFKIIGASGASIIRNSNYLVSIPDGTDTFETAAQDVTAVVSNDCTVRFETNGGSELPDQTVTRGEKMKAPSDPTKEGYHLEGWYRDIDLQSPWDFSKDTVDSNMTLYAAWAEGAPAAKTGSPLLWILLGAAVLALLAALLLLRNPIIRFETNGGSTIPNRKVKKGSKLRKLPVPEKENCTFCGWYKDADCTEVWNEKTDTVTRSMTLYAKWG